MANTAISLSGHVVMISMDIIIGRWTMASICVCILSVKRKGDNERNIIPCKADR